MWPPRAEAFAQDQPFFICDKHSAPVVDLPVLVFYGNWHSGSTVLGGHGVVKSVSDYLVRDSHTGDMLEVVF